MHGAGGAAADDAESADGDDADDDDASAFLATPPSAEPPAGAPRTGEPADDSDKEISVSGTIRLPGNQASASASAAAGATLCGPPSSGLAVLAGAAARGRSGERCRAGANMAGESTGSSEQVSPAGQWRGGAEDWGVGLAIAVAARTLCITGQSAQLSLSSRG